MQIKTIKLGKTYNDGNYESTRIDIEVDLVEGEDSREVFGEMLEEIERLRRKQRKHNNQPKE